MGWYLFFMYIYVSEWHGKLSINSGQLQLSRAAESSANLAPCDREFHAVSQRSRSAEEQRLLALIRTAALDRHHLLWSQIRAPMSQLLRGWQAPSYSGRVVRHFDGAKSTLQSNSSLSCFDWCGVDGKTQKWASEFKLCYVDGVKWSTKFSVMFCYFGFSRLHKKKNEKSAFLFIFSCF